MHSGKKLNASIVKEKVTRSSINLIQKRTKWNISIGLADTVTVQELRGCQNIDELCLCFTSQAKD